MIASLIIYLLFVNNLLKKSAISISKQFTNINNKINGWLKKTAI